MKVGEWYTNPSSSTQYLMRVTVVDDEAERGGEYKTFSYFYISKKKECGTKDSEQQSVAKGWIKLKDKGQTDKLEQFYRVNSGPTEEEQLDDFLKELEPKKKPERGLMNKP